MPSDEPLYDEAYGPRPYRRRPTSEWIDPYAAVDVRVSVGQLGRRRFQDDQRDPRKRRPRQPRLPAAPKPKQVPNTLLTPPEPAPARWPGLWSVPQMAELRRAGMRLGEVGSAMGLSPTTLRWLFKQAGFNQYGWRSDMAQRCERCNDVYSPWYVQRSYSAAWPTRFCSHRCMTGVHEVGRT